MVSSSHALDLRPLWAGGAALMLSTSTAFAAPASPRVSAISELKPAEFVAGANAPETREDCLRLHPSKARLLRWFSRARVVEQPAWLEEGDQSACRLSGVVVTRGGARHPFQLGRGGMGRIETAPGASVYLLGPELPAGR